MKQLIANDSQQEGEEMTRSRPAFRVHICDGCCCGTTRKHPGFDHAAQRARIAEAAQAGGGAARVVGCLGACHASNLVVVRRPGQRAKWIGGVLSDRSTNELCAWLSHGATTMSPGLQLQLVTR
jgi:cytochrome c5